MNKPQEHEYASHVAYCRALEAYCEALQAEVAARDMVIKQMREAILQFRNEKALGRAHSVRETEGYGAMERCIDPDFQPSTEALDAYVAEKVAAERERCAGLCEDIDAINSRGWGDVLAKRIRASPKPEQ